LCVRAPRMLIRWAIAWCRYLPSVLSFTGAGAPRETRHHRAAAVLGNSRPWSLKHGSNRWTGAPALGHLIWNQPACSAGRHDCLMRSRGITGAPGNRYRQRRRALSRSNFRLRAARRGDLRRSVREDDRDDAAQTGGSAGEQVALQRTSHRGGHLVLLGGQRCLQRRRPVRSAPLQNRMGGALAHRVAKFLRLLC
jgi:hypothetical protein